MTREEAITVLTKINTDWVDRPREQTDALDLAIEALTPASLVPDGFSGDFFCSNCGKYLNKNVRFCSWCGKKMEDK